MNANHTCPECGKPVAPNSLQGLCPECMMKVGLARETAETQPAATNAPAASAKSPPSLAEIAALFPQLEILECLGCGGMGVVYKARQPHLDRLVALKILLPEPGVQDAHFAERFQREARALARLSHPNIVAMHEFGQAGGKPYFIMEYVDGLNLRQLEQAGKLSARQALQIIPQICEALQFAHDEGVVHRDVKPENILLDKRGRVKIADFGIAKMLGANKTPALTQGQQVIGTPHYMAPEQVEKPQTVDHRADIYSLGVVFYEMLTGELPLGKFAPPSRKVEVDVRLDEVVLRALEKEPEQRYQNASQVKTDVEHISSSPESAAATRTAELRLAAVSGAFEQIQRQVRRPAIGLVIVFVLNWILIPLTVLLIKVSPWGATPFPVSRAAAVGLALLPLGLCSFGLFAALKMMRLEAYSAAITASILAILITPGNIVGLPLGIWALVVLLQQDVRGAFAQVAQLRPADTRRAAGVAMSLALLLLALVSAVLFFASAPRPLAFGPVTQCLLNDPDWSRTESCLDLDTGRLSSSEQLRRSGIDIVSDSSGKSIQLLDLCWAPLENGDFRTLSPAALARLIGTFPAPPEPVETLTVTNPPATFGFKTRDGSAGVCQITGFTEDVRAVILRYKLLHPPPQD